MKKFRFKYSPVVWLLLAVVLVLSVGGLVWNIFNLVEFYSFKQTFDLVSYGVIIAVCAFLVVFVLAVIFYGNYVIKGQTLYTYFGFFRAKMKIDDIVGISLFKKSNKLVVYFKEQEYSIIVIDQNLYDDFVVAIRKVNPKIIYDTRIEGEDLAK